MKGFSIGVTAVYINEATMPLLEEYDSAEPIGDETDVNNRQVGEEEVHGGVEVGVRDDSQDDEQVPEHCDQVHGQEKSKEDRLPVWVL
ncbi:hypothetical protein H920_05979 [Fukomys damarensis]|uniref:Uncharacterized protein n=1 Tax=Fukomys damarensis TaxID=885580 RepID=A0A091DQ60_FUKDA|nr:hypothetical protein H920_05979 [Fukomys damarensis]